MYSTRRDRKWENSVKKIGRVLSAQRRTERFSYWILLAMLGLSSSICPNQGNFYDLTARRFRFHSCVKRSRTSKRPIGFASQTNVHFFPFVHSCRTHNSFCIKIVFCYVFLLIPKKISYLKHKKIQKCSAIFIVISICI